MVLEPPKEKIYNMRFNEEEYEKIKDYAKQKYNLPMSKFIRMLIDNDISGESTSREIQEYENKVVDALRKENQLLIRKIDLMSETILKHIDLKTDKILLPSYKSYDGSLEVLESQILDFLDSFDSKGSYKKYSLSEIANYLNTIEEITLKVLDSLESEKKVKMYLNGMKYGRVK